MSDRIKIGIVGCGWIAEKAHLPAIQKNKNVEVVSIFDNDCEKIRTISKYKNDYQDLKIYSNYQDLLNSAIDAVIICTPNHLHVQQSLEALEANKHVLCEKPIAFNSKEVQEIISLAEQKKKVYLPGFVNRFRDDILELQNVIQKHKFIKIDKIEAGWLRKSGLPRPGSWFTNKDYSGGGVLIDLGSHIIDICLKIMKPGTIAGIEKNFTYPSKECTNQNNWFHREGYETFDINVEDSVHAVVNFANDTSLDLKLGWDLPVKNDSTFFKVYSDDSYIELRTLFGYSSNRLWSDSTIEVFSKGKRTEVFKVDNAGLKLNTNAFFGLSNYFQQQIETANADGYLTMKDGLETVKLIEAIYSN